MLFLRSGRGWRWRCFAGSFLLLGVTQALLTLGDFHDEERSWLYLLRLAAFLLILFAMWWQNRGRRSL